MTNFILALLLLLLAVAGVVVRKTYYFIPLLELKRRAAINDPLAAKLYPAVSYTNSLRGLLWLFIALTSAGGVILLSREAPVWLSLLAVLLLIWAIYSWLPASKTTSIGVALTSAVNPAILWLLGHLHPALDRTTSLVEKRYTAEAHTGLYEKDDLVSLIEQQQRQRDGRFTEEELEIAKRALSFDDYSVNDVIIPKKSVKSVLAEDVVGPILIDELHKSRQEHVLVRESAKGDFVGTLNYKRFNLHSTGKVKDYMDSTIYYVHEDDSLSEAMRTFFDTNHALFLVVNNAEEYVGIITIETILRQLLGHIPGEAFEGHGNSAAVVARHKQTKMQTQKEHEINSHEELAVIEDEEAELAEAEPEEPIEAIESEVETEEPITEVEGDEEVAVIEKRERVIDEEIDMSEEDDDEQPEKDNVKSSKS